MREKCALVIGASSGIGAAVARHLARRGYRVALVARREDELAALAEQINSRSRSQTAFVYPHDVTQFDEVPALFDRIASELGGLEMVVYAAGVMPPVEPGEYDFAKDRLMVEVNLLGTIAWLNEAADLFTRLKRGVIVGVGSIAGDRGRAGQPVYNTSKGAQAIYLEALRNRLAAHNVRVVTIKPGYVATAMTAGMGNLLWMISAHEAGRQIVNAALESRGVVYVPARWRLVAWVLIHIPSFIFRRLGI
ncbi:SDR family NAD(P)-dependent oxidoreductase [Candidatus Poribacteria bacterium]|nr:SDR family NAD(P)-dependent oxidoreductase [Candidatus Poribacteria bacterium]